MGQILHKCARTTEALRRAIQVCEESIAALAKRYDLNPKTVHKWKRRPFTHDERMGPKNPGSTVLTVEEEAIVVAFRQMTLLPLDDCLYTLQSSIPRLTRSTLHRCFWRHGISRRLPEVEGGKPEKKKFKAYPIDYFHIDIAEVHTQEGKLYPDTATVQRHSGLRMGSICAAMSTTLNIALPSPGTPGRTGRSSV